MSDQVQPSQGMSDPRTTEADEFPKRFGKYTLLRKLAVGGMAELFLALHRSVADFEKLIVIKRILPSVTHDRAFVDMLLQEARIAATLSHPNIVQIYDVGQAEGRYYIAMEYIHGEDLRSIIRQMKRKNLTHFPMEHALTITLGVCAGLAYAHEHRGLDGRLLNIVHRDISPQNILVTYTGDIKIVDFGIAKVGNQMSDDTRVGKLKGKVPYMSPEQARGEVIDARSDIFSTGILLFELTTGKRLFKAKSELETMRLICDRQYPRPSQIVPGYPPRLEKIVMKALEKDASRRYQSAREMQADLDAYIREFRIEASTLKLRAWMETLFVERLEKQKAVLQDLKKLADVIASESFSDTDVGDTSHSHGGTTDGVGGTKTRKPSASILGVAVALAVGMVIAISVVLWIKKPWLSSQSGTTATSSARLDQHHRPKHAYGSVHIESIPPGAAIWVDGQLYPAKTPATVTDLPRHTPVTIKLTQEGLLPKRKKFVLDDAQPNQTWKVDMRLGTFSVHVKCNVPGALITVDGKVVKEPRIDGLAVGKKHKIIVSAAGYRTQTFTVEGQAKENKTLSVVLVKATTSKSAGVKESSEEKKEKKPSGNGKLNVGSRGGYCNVSIGGRSYGPTPVGGIVLPAGSHVVVCKPSDGPAKSMSVTIKPGQTSRISFRLGK